MCRPPTMHRGGPHDLQEELCAETKPEHPGVSGRVGLLLSTRRTIVLNREHFQDHFSIRKRDRKRRRREATNKQAETEVEAKAEGEQKIKPPTCLMCQSASRWR